MKQRKKTSEERWLSRPHYKRNPSPDFGRVMTWQEYTYSQGVLFMPLPVTAEDMYSYIYYANAQEYNVIGQGVQGSEQTVMNAVRKGIILNEYAPQWKGKEDDPDIYRAISDWLNHGNIPLDILVEG